MHDKNTKKQRENKGRKVIMKHGKRKKTSKKKEMEEIQKEERTTIRVRGFGRGKEKMKRGHRECEKIKEGKRYREQNVKIGGNRGSAIETLRLKDSHNIRNFGIKERC